MKKYIFVFLFFLCNTALIGQTINREILDTLPKKGGSYFGVNAGFTTGLGFSYIYWPGKNGFQITFLPLIDKEEKYISAALTYFLTLKEKNATKVFMYVGNHLTNLSAEDFFFNFGIGPGIEGGLEDLKIHFMVGYALLNFPDNPMSRPTVEAGLFYKF